MEQKEHIAACQSSQQDNWADSCAQKNREIWSDRAPLICFLSKSPKQSTRPEAPGAEEWLKCYLLLWSSCVPANLLGFCFRLDSPLLGAVFHFTAPILPLQPPRCAAVRVCFQLLVMSSADPPWNQPTPFCQELETHPRSHTSYPHSSRVCAHYEKHFLWFSEINVLNTFIIVIVLIACWIGAAKKSTNKQTKQNETYRLIKKKIL